MGGVDVENIFAKRMDNVPSSFISEILKLIDDTEIISFAGGLPNKDLFPVEEIRNAANYQLENYGTEILQYSTTEGYLPLREFIAERYNKNKNLNISAENVLITHGSQQALDLIGKVFLNDNDAVAIEEPGYLGAIQCLSIFSKNFVPIKLENDGLNLEELHIAYENFSPKIIYTVPNFQNPTGISYSFEKRNKIVDLLKSYNTFIIEDDPYGELRYEDEEIESFGKLLPEQTILLGSFSKIVAPGFRIGWLIAPDKIMDKFVIAKQAADLHSNYVGQRIIYQYLKDTDLDKHILDIKATYNSQRLTMIESIERYFPKSVEFTKPNGGMFLWVTLPKNISAVNLLNHSIEKKVAFVPGDPFYVKKSDVNTLRLNYSCSDEKTIEEGIKRLAICIKELIK